MGVAPYTLREAVVEEYEERLAIMHDSAHDLVDPITGKPSTPEIEAERLMAKKYGLRWRTHPHAK